MKKNYKNLFEKAKKRNYNEFKKENKCAEKHHFIPKSLFEDKKAKLFLIKLLETEHNDINDNVHPLTCREHYIAHLLLWKIFEKENINKSFNKMTYALHLFTSKIKRKGLKVNSIFYEKLRIKKSNIHRNFMKNKVFVTEKDTGLKLTISSDEYKNNKDKYIHNMSWKSSSFK